MIAFLCWWYLMDVFKVAVIHAPFNMALKVTLARRNIHVVYFTLYCRIGTFGKFGEKKSFCMESVLQSLVRSCLFLVFFIPTRKVVISLPCADSVATRVHFMECRLTVEKCEHSESTSFNMKNIQLWSINCNGIYYKSEDLPWVASKPAHRNSSLCLIGTSEWRDN